MQDPVALGGGGRGLVVSGVGVQLGLRVTWIEKEIKGWAGTTAVCPASR